MADSIDMPLWTVNRVAQSNMY